MNSCIGYAAHEGKNYPVKFSMRANLPVKFLALAAKSEKGEKFPLAKISCHNYYNRLLEQHYVRQSEV